MPRSGARETQTLKDENVKLKRELVRKDKAGIGGGSGVADTAKKIPRAVEGRGQMTTLPERDQMMSMVAAHTLTVLTNVGEERILHRTGWRSIEAQ